MFTSRRTVYPWQHSKHLNPSLIDLNRLGKDWFLDDWFNWWPINFKFVCKVLGMTKWCFLGDNVRQGALNIVGKTHDFTISHLPTKYSAVVGFPRKWSVGSPSLKMKLGLDFQVFIFWLSVKILLMVQKFGVHQLSLVVYPIYMVFYIPGGCLGFFPPTVATNNKPMRTIKNKSKDHMPSSLRRSRYCLESWERIPIVWCLFAWWLRLEFDSIPEILYKKWLFIWGSSKCPQHHQHAQMSHRSSMYDCMMRPVVKKQTLVQSMGHVGSFPTSQPSHQIIEVFLAVALQMRRIPRDSYRDAVQKAGFDRANGSLCVSLT